LGENSLIQNEVGPDEAILDFKRLGLNVIPTIIALASMRSQIIENSPLKTEIQKRSVSISLGLGSEVHLSGYFSPIAVERQPSAR
jgi:hypothetical protein